jgi:hypothetical protein
MTLYALILCFIYFNPFNWPKTLGVLLWMIFVIESGLRVYQFFN